MPWSSTITAAGERLAGLEVGEPGTARGYVDMFNGVSNFRTRLLPGTNAANYDLIFPNTGPAQYDVAQFGAGGQMVFAKVSSDLLTTGAKTFSSDIVFSATDADTVAWATGSIQTADGGTYAISAGNTGNMAAKSVIYLDTDVSSTVLQVSTNVFDAVGDNKLLICVAWPSLVSGKAAYVPRVGTLGINDVSILANSVSSDAVQANAITAGKINVVSLDAISAAMGDLTSGSITLTGAGSYFRMGSTPPSSATVGTGLWFDYTGLYGLASSVQTFVLSATDGSLKLRSSTGTKYIDIGVGTANEMAFYEGGAIKVRIGSSVFGGTPGIAISGVVAATVYVTADQAMRIGLVGSYTGQLTLEHSGSTPGMSGILSPALLTSTRNWTLPNVDGTVITTGNLTSITTVGTIAAGTWQGTAIADAYISTSGNWNTAYSERHQWDGGSTNLVATTGRTSLGLGTIATKNVGTSSTFDTTIHAQIIFQDGIAQSFA